MCRQTDEYMHPRHEIPTPPRVPKFFVFVPKTLTACPSAASIPLAEPLAVTASGERSLLDITASPHLTSDMSNSEASQY